MKGRPARRYRGKTGTGTRVGGISSGEGDSKAAEGEITARLATAQDEGSPTSPVICYHTTIYINTKTNEATKVPPSAKKLSPKPKRNQE